MDAWELALLAKRLRWRLDELLQRLGVGWNELRPGEKNVEGVIRHLLRVGEDPWWIETVLTTEEP